MNDQRKCLMQKGDTVSAKWCDKAQYKEICGKAWGVGKDKRSCPYNEGRERSKYQMERDDEKK
jgi:hypothetical protein